MRPTFAVPRWVFRVVYTGNLFIHPSGSPADTVAKFESRLAALSSMKSTRNVPVFVQQFGVRTGDDPTGLLSGGGIEPFECSCDRLHGVAMAPEHVQYE